MSKDMFNSTQQDTLPCYSYYLPHSPALDLFPLVASSKPLLLWRRLSPFPSQAEAIRQKTILQPTAIGRFWRS